jgi:LDH2 family malate/lactate/ureidoglycolate dehydrogenase
MAARPSSIASELSTGFKIVTLEEIEYFIIRCMLAVDTKKEHAESLAKTLVAADYRGHYSHGLNRLEMYVKDMKGQTCVSNTNPEILKQTVATAWVDGRNLLGPVVGNFCMDLANQKAKEAGVGWVVAKGSNHYGIAGWYSLRALEHGLIGFSGTNTSPFMVPTRGKKAVLGTNPITMAAPAKNGDSFVLDMATTAVAVGKIEVQRRKNEPLPYGWAVDKEGQVTTNADTAMDGGYCLPLGGTEETSGYKGYGLGMMVEAMCGILAGSAFGPFVRQWMSSTGPANLGQFFIAVDPNVFAPGYEERMSALLDHCRGVETVAGSPGPVLAPGDPERKHIEECHKLGGVKYHPSLIKACDDLAKDLGVQPMKIKM